MNLDKEKKLDIVTGEYVKLQYHNADLGKRIFATLIDWVALGIFTYVSYKIGNSIWRYITSNVWRDTLAFGFVFVFSFFSFFWEYLFNGRTIGKMIMKIRTINSNGIPPTFLECFLRWLLMPLDFVIGAILIGKYEKRLGDFASGCSVVYNFSAVEEEFDTKKELRYLNKGYKVKYSQVAELEPEEFYSIP